MKTKKTLKQVSLGQFFTKGDNWLLPQVKRFIKKINPKVIVDPFAGEGDLLTVIQDTFQGLKIKGFDIDKGLGWDINNSLVEIPKIPNSLILTNPPYLAKNSAKRRKLKEYKYFKDNQYVDLYQVALEKCLQACEFVVAIIPESYISSLAETKIRNINSVSIIEKQLFTDTSCPVCIVCFNQQQPQTTYIYKENKKIGKLSKIIKIREDFLNVEQDPRISFNQKEGQIALIAIDSHTRDRIRFLKPSELNYDLNNIKISSRSITVIDIGRKNTNSIICRANKLLENYRTITHDILLTPFMGNNKNGRRRRRLDFKLARAILNRALKEK